MRNLINLTVHNHRYTIELMSNGTFLVSKFSLTVKDELTGLDYCEVDSFHRYYEEAWFQLREYMDHELRLLFTEANPRIKSVY